MCTYNLFKYREINKYLIDSLINSELFFALPSRLNDPFDCNIDLNRSFRKAVPQDVKDGQLHNMLRSGYLAERVKEFSKSIGVCSFSLELRDVLMWSHYASNHTGVALCYSFNESYLNDERKIIGISPVAYDENGITEWLKANLDSDEYSPQELVIELLKKYITAKGPSWSYEKEARIIRQNSGPFEIPRTCLKQVCFGLHTSERDIRLVSKIIENHYSDVVLCKVERGESDFGIDVKEI